MAALTIRLTPATVIKQNKRYNLSLKHRLATCSGSRCGSSLETRVNYGGNILIIHWFKQEETANRIIRITAVAG